MFTLAEDLGKRLLRCFLVCGYAAVHLFISSLHNSTCPFFLLLGSHKEVFCLVLSPWLLFSCSLMQAERWKESFPKPRGFFLPAPQRKHAPTLRSAASLYSAYKGRGRGFSRGAQTVRPERRRGRGTHLGHLPQRVHHAEHSGSSEWLPLHQPGDHPRVLLLQFVKKWAQDPPPLPFPCYKAILCCGVSHWGRWSRWSDLQPPLDGLDYRHQGRRSCDCQHLFLPVGKITCFKCHFGSIFRILSQESAD